MRKTIFFSFFILAGFSALSQDRSDSLMVVSQNGDTLFYSEAEYLAERKDSKVILNQRKALFSGSNRAQSAEAGSFISGEASNWVFGSYIGLKFNTDGTKELLSSSMTASEGCASISDAQGNLLLYTNGLDVYNAAGQLINTQTLRGSQLSTQSGVIVPYPGDEDKYFIFTVPDTYSTGGADGFYYSIVDMSLENAAGGEGTLLKVDGDLEYKLVKENCVERIAAVKHKNGRDYWIIADYKGTNEYFAYKITNEGIDSDHPVVNAIGTAHGGDNTFGGIKFSPDGTQFVSARGVHTSSTTHSSDARVEVYDFNNETGVLSNYRDVTPLSSNGRYYGVEFSPDGKCLYVGTIISQQIYQIKLSTGDKELVFNGSDPDWIGMLQLGIDGNIYYTIRKKSVYAITSPSEKKTLQSFDAENILTASGVELGLPNFISSFTYRDNSCALFESDFTYYPHSCGVRFLPLFENENDCDVMSYSWDFGDGTTSAKADPFHVYASPGVFEVSLNMTADCHDGSGACSQFITHSVDVAEDVLVANQRVQVESFLIDSVLSASASSFSGSWMMDYDDEALSGTHPYLNGSDGVWRSGGSYLYREDREVSESADLRQDGTFSLESFNWAYAELEAIPGWLRANTVTKYSPYSHEVENRDILGNYSSALYGYGGQLPVAVGQNMRHSEMAYTGFEELNSSGFAIVDDASQKGTGNWTVSESATRGRREIFNVKLGVGNLALINAPIDELEAIDTVMVTAYRLWFETGPFLLPLTVSRRFNKVAILCKEPYGEFNGQTNLALDKVIDESRWSGYILYYQPYKRGTASDISETVAHTGARSLRITTSRKIRQNYIELIPGREYRLSAWLSVNDRFLYTPVLGEGLGIRLWFYDGEDRQVGEVFLEPSGNIIEGWQKLEKSFVCPDSASYFSVEFDPGTAPEAYFDDLRLFPEKGNMQSYVYEPDTYRLKAVLDENNYASLYYYDTEGNLYLVKKETERGIRAIRESVSYQKENDIDE